jgi:capsular polysaccharide transport system permease protein
MLERSGWDPVWALPGTFWRSNEERLYRHYQAFISNEFDKTTEISTLRVQAFAPNDAQRIATALLQKSEALLNRLNERAQNDAIASALKQVDASKKRALDALQKVTDFRNREAVIDPTLQSAVVLEAVAALSVEMAQTNAQLAELLKSSPDSPQISSLRLRIAALENQVAKERAQFGGSAASLAPRIAEYERLTLEREFAARAFVLALSTLESAKVDAVRRRTYLEQIARPNLSDYARYPFRLIWILAIGAFNFAIYWILRYLLRDTVAHAQG